MTQRCSGVLILALMVYSTPSLAQSYALPDPSSLDLDARVQNVLPIGPLKEGIIPRSGDEDVVAVIGGEPLPRKEIRHLAGFYAASDPTLTPQEAFKRALVSVVADKAKYAEAVARGIKVSLAEATRIRDEQRKLCQQSRDCRTFIQAITEARGITEEHYWEEAITLYQQSLKISELVNTVIEGGPGLDAPGEQIREFIVDWEKELVGRTSIRWQDKELGQLYPVAVATFEPVVRAVQGETESVPAP